MQVNILFFFFLLFVFQHPLESVSPFIQFSDEILSIIAGIFLLNKVKISRGVLFGIFCTAVFTSYVIVMSVMSELYRGIFLTLLDIILFLKVS